jgi:phospholipid/cholesterol/gamma-HCH transport system substrate-binding protein
MESRAHALAAGLFMLLMSFGVALAVWYLSSNDERGREYLLVTTSAVGGLSPQAQVRYRGIRVGKVREISINPANPREIQVRIDIPARYPVTAATRARLSYLGVTGLALIDLDDDGSAPEPLKAGDDGLGRIPLSGSQIESLGKQATDTMDALRQVLQRLSALLDEHNVERMSGVLANLQSATGRLDTAMAEVPAVLVQTRQTLARAQALMSPQNIEHVSRILENAEQTSAGTAPLVQELRDLLVSMKALSGRLDTLAGSAGGQVTEDALPRLQRLLDEAQRNSRQLGRVLGELESSPQMLLLGRDVTRPGPGEPGFDPKTGVPSR